MDAETANLTRGRGPAGGSPVSPVGPARHSGRCRNDGQAGNGVAAACWSHGRQSITGPPLLGPPGDHPRPGSGGSRRPRGGPGRPRGASPPVPLPLRPDRHRGDGRASRGDAAPAAARAGGIPAAADGRPRVGRAHHPRRRRRGALRLARGLHPGVRPGLRNDPHGGARHAAAHLPPAGAAQPEWCAFPTAGRPPPPGPHEGDRDEPAPETRRSPRRHPHRRPRARRHPPRRDPRRTDRGVRRDDRRRPHPPIRDQRDGHPGGALGLRPPRGALAGREPPHDRRSDRPARGLRPGLPGGGGAGPRCGHPLRHRRRHDLLAADHPHDRWDHRPRHHLRRRAPDPGDRRPPDPRDHRLGAGDPRPFLEAAAG